MAAKKKLTADEVTERIVKLLFDQAAAKWTVQEKGNLLAAIKLQLQNRD